MEMEDSIFQEESRKEDQAVSKRKRSEPEEEDLFHSESKPHKDEKETEKQDEESEEDDPFCTEPKRIYDSESWKESPSIGKKPKGSTRENFKVDRSVWEKFLDHDTTFRELKVLYNEIKGTTSTKNKKRILRNHPECVKALLYVYHPYKHYQITIGHIRGLLGSHLAKNPRSQWIDRQGNVIGVPSDIFELMEILDTRKVTGNDAIDMVISFVDKNKEFKNLILEMLDKDLKIHCNAKTINAVFPDLIPYFPVALAEKYNEKGKSIDLVKESWFWSRKYDGVRLICIVPEKGDIEFRSRQGNSFFTLKVLENQLKQVGWPRGYVIDGEVCKMEDGLENFKRIVSDIKQRGFTIPSPKYYMFDMIKIEEFWKGSSEIGLIDRMSFLKKNFLLSSAKSDSFSNYFSVVKQSKIKDEEELMNIAHQANSLGWEGLIIRKDVGYEGKRSNNMLKVKRFQEKEFICLGVNKSSMSIKRDGKQIQVEVAGSITVDMGDGNTVDVGTGFNMEERERYFHHPGEIIGKDITVSFMEYSYDKNGKPSLRFPAFKCVYDSTKRDI